MVHRASRARQGGYPQAVPRARPVAPPAARYGYGLGKSITVVTRRGTGAGMRLSCGCGALCYSLPLMSETIAERIEAVKARIAEAERRAGRPPGAVTLCAVTKTFPASAVVEAAAAGVSHVGENRVAEAEGKIPEASGAAPVVWHLIGHLQSNKARRAVELFDVVETVDSLKLADRLDRLAGELGRRLAVYIQVDLGHEATKSGAGEEQVEPIATRLARSEFVTVEGLMTVPPYFDDRERVRPYFRRLRELRDHLNRSSLLPRPIAGLSMGMSHDFEVAVEEGATLVRVGSAIFGARE